MNDFPRTEKLEGVDQCRRIMGLPLMEAAPPKIRVVWGGTQISGEVRMESPGSLSSSGVMFYFTFDMQKHELRLDKIGDLDVGDGWFVSGVTSKGDCEYWLTLLNNGLCLAVAGENIFDVLRRYGFEKV